MSEDTELKLINWRHGQTYAERLCASILVIEGFASVDPQCPLGGPDGLKDLLCEKSGWKYVGAAYFPPTPQEFKDIKEKFIRDVAGVSKNDVDGIVFLTNQKLTPGERDKLVREASGEDAKAIIYHLERIRLILETPVGFGLRLEFLNIPMTQEDQISFFANSNTVFLSALQQQADNISELSQKLDEYHKPVSQDIHRLANLLESTRFKIDDLLQGKILPNSEEVSIDADCPATKLINSNSLCMLHRALMLDHRYPETIGQPRKVQNWIGPPGSTPEKATYLPPPPEEVPRLMEDMLSWWRQIYDDILAGDTSLKIHSMAEFHHRFLTIHPFTDGNGRISRFLLNQQVLELLALKKSVVIKYRQPYFSALQAAHAGDMKPLVEVITQSIFGTEEYLG